MSNDKKRRAIINRLRENFIEKTENRLKSADERVVVYVQGASGYISNKQVASLIVAAMGSIEQEMIFEGTSRKQFKTSIQKQHLDALYEGWPSALDISKKAFKHPSNMRVKIKGLSPSNG